MSTVLQRPRLNRIKRSEELNGEIDAPPEFADHFVTVPELTYQVRKLYGYTLFPSKLGEVLRRSDCPPHFRVGTLRVFLKPPALEYFNPTNPIIKAPPRK